MCEYLPTWEQNRRDVMDSPATLKQIRGAGGCFQLFSTSERKRPNP